MATPHVLYRGNDNLVEFEVGKFLTDATTGDTVAAATVTVTLFETDGTTEILAAVTMTAVSGSSGNYRGNIPDTLDLSSHTEVIADVSADNGANAKGRWKLRTSIKERR